MRRLIAFIFCVYSLFKQKNMHLKFLSRLWVGNYVLSFSKTYNFFSWEKLVQWSFFSKKTIYSRFIFKINLSSSRVIKHFGKTLTRKLSNRLINIEHSKLSKLLYKVVNTPCLLKLTFYSEEINFWIDKKVISCGISDNNFVQISRRIEDAYK